MSLIARICEIYPSLIVPDWLYCERCTGWFRCYGEDEWAEREDHRQCGDCDHLCAEIEAWHRLDALRLAEWWERVERYSAAFESVCEHEEAA